MPVFDHDLKKFVLGYDVKNHNIAKKNADVLFNKYPKEIVIFNTIGVLFLQNKKFIDAISVFKRLLILNPKDINTLHNLGVAWTQIANFDQAIKSYLKSEKLGSKNPLTYYNLALLYSRKSDYKLAILKQKKAINLDPEVEKFYFNLAEYVTKLGDYIYAIKNYVKVLKINPKHLGARYNLSRLYLATENFNKGWNDCELRIQYSQTNFSEKIKNILKLKQWTGKSFNGTLFVHGEQGVGDLILHSSIIIDLQKIHNKICLIVDNRFVSLFKRSFDKIKIISYNQNIHFDFNDEHILLASLGKFLRKSINDFKKPPISFIIADNKKTNFYKENLSINNKIKIGLSWKTIGTNNAERNISLESLSQIISHKKFDIINLQYGDYYKEKISFEKNYGKKIIDMNGLDLNNDFDSLAALINSCDLILTISNITAHLSGSLGKKTYVMIPLDTQWHWFYKRMDSLWYPNVKLFRQNFYGKWDDVIKTVFNELLKNY